MPQIVMGCNEKEKATSEAKSVPKFIMAACLCIRSKAGTRLIREALYAPPLVLPFYLGMTDGYETC